VVGIPSSSECNHYKLFPPASGCSSVPDKPFSRLRRVKWRQLKAKENNVLIEFAHFGIFRRKIEQIQVILMPVLYPEVAIAAGLA
jgi:hypothetical protein